jgi:hypothetical protein
MSINNYSWGDDLIESGDIGLESFESNLTQSNDIDNDAPFFKPINIVVENGIYYVNIYTCCATNRTDNNAKLLEFLGSLKETDVVKLTISSLLIGIPIQAHLSLIGAIYRCKAKIEIQLDTIVSDNLAYFYLVANSINKGYAGSLFIPSYIDSRQDHKSSPWRVVHDFVQEIIDHAVAKGVLTQEEADRLNSGKHVIIPNDRF